MPFSPGLPCGSVSHLGNRQFQLGRGARSAPSPAPGNRLIAGKPAAMNPVFGAESPMPGVLARGEGSDVTMLLQEDAKKGL